jgi:two-component system phosphate regulon response regulator PhoB
MPSSILVVEDEPAIQLLIATNLRRAGHAVNTALNAEAAMQLVNNALPDLILLDWMLPGMNGLDFIRRLRGDVRTYHVPIIMLTAKAEENDRVMGLENGADDYITKPFSPRELLARIQAVLRCGRPQATAEAVSAGNLKLDPASHRVSIDGNQVSLGPTEFRLLHFLMTHPDQVHSRDRLLDQVWGDHVFIEERTVDVHIRRVRAVLEPTGCHYLIQTVRGCGYRFSVENVK